MLHYTGPVKDVSISWLTHQWSKQCADNEKPVKNLQLGRCLYSNQIYINKKAVWIKLFQHATTKFMHISVLTAWT
jgi:hypothetical protein